MSIKNINEIKIAGHDELKISISLGITRVHRRDSFDLLYQTADEAMYKAKRNKKNSYEWY